MFQQEASKAAEALLQTCRGQGLKIATAESCTGGLVAALLTEIAGSSDVVERGFVTYSNQAKIQMLGVDAPLIAQEGAVSELVARAMAEGALIHSQADISIAITGIAGPGGGSEAKPVGLVHLAAARRGFATRHWRHVFKGDRQEVRLQAMLAAIAYCGEMASLHPMA